MISDPPDWLHLLDGGALLDEPEPPHGTVIVLSDPIGTVAAVVIFHSHDIGGPSVHCEDRARALRLSELLELRLQAARSLGASPFPRRWLRAALPGQIRAMEPGLEVLGPFSCAHPAINGVSLGGMVPAELLPMSPRRGHRTTDNWAKGA